MNIFVVPAGAVKGARTSLATRLDSLKKAKGTAGYTFAIRVGLSERPSHGTITRVLLRASPFFVVMQRASVCIHPLSKICKEFIKGAIFLNGGPALLTCACHVQLRCSAGDRHRAVI